MNKKEIIQEELAKMVETKSKKPCRIKYKDQFLITYTRKTVWKTLGAAKSALRHHFRKRATAYSRGYNSYEEYYKSVGKTRYHYSEVWQREKEFFDALYKEVEFVFV
jgi:hypothetical protein